MGAINLRDFGADIFECPACGASLLVRLGRDETLVRCVKCRGTPIHLSMIEAILQLGFGRHRDVCELSSRGALVDFLKRSFHRVSTSEFFDGIELGSSIGEVRCEDVMSLTYPDREFDLFTCTEVFEHVADDLAGFREVRRVLKDSGAFVFTVPLVEDRPTLERARMVDGKPQHLYPPSYHGDRLRGRGRVLVFRDYGSDIRERLLAAGFGEVSLFRPARDFLGYRRTVIVARGRAAAETAAR